MEKKDKTKTKNEKREKSETPEVRGGKVRKGMPAPVDGVFQTRFFYRCLLLFLLLPLAVKVIFSILPAVGAFFLLSRGAGDGVLLAAQICAILDDVLTPAITSAAVCTLGYGLYRLGAGGCRHALWTAAVCPLFLRMFLLLVTYLLVSLRWIDQTPSSFSQNLFSYFMGSLLLYAGDLFFLLLLVFLYHRGGKRFAAKEMALAGRKRIFGKKSGYTGLVRATVWIYIARQALGTSREIVTALSGGADGWSLWEIAQNYGVWSRETVLTLFSGGLLPLFYLILTGVIVFFFSRYAAGKAEELYFSHVKGKRDALSGEMPRPAGSESSESEG